MIGQIGIPLLHILTGDEAGLWVGVLVMLLAVFIVGGSLLVFLVKAARRQDNPGDASC